MNNSIKNHRVFNTEDYEKLQNKGYGDAEITEIWDRDIRQRVLSDLLWIDAQSPQEAEEILTEFKKMRGENPFISNPINHA